MWREMVFRDAVFGTDAVEGVSRWLERGAVRGMRRLGVAAGALAHALDEAARVTGELSEAMPRRRSGGRLR